VTLAHIDPLVKLQDDFGAMDINKIESAKKTSLPKTDVQNDK